MKGTLFIIATPIGNMEDITERAKRILSEADIIAAEDTRTTQMLLRLLGIQNKTVSNHKFNEKHQAEFLLNELENGKNVALVSDAGTPCISDPGAIIVKAAVERNIPVTGICGASAVITALSICGFSFDSFAFYGYFPRTLNEIKKSADKMKKSGINTAIFFESPKRIKKTMELLAQEIPDAELCLCNDLSKMHERIYRGSAVQVLDELNSNPSAEKGEYTLVINLETKSETEHKAESETVLSAEAMLVDYIIKNNVSAKEAVNALSVKHKDIARKEFYAASLKIKQIFSQ